jgi:hypothetical protein
VIAPLFPPKQETFCETDNADESAAAGWVTVIAELATQLLASVTVTV